MWSPEWIEQTHHGVGIGETVVGNPVEVCVDCEHEPLGSERCGSVSDGGTSGFVRGIEMASGFTRTGFDVNGVTSRDEFGHAARRDSHSTFSVLGLSDDGDSHGSGQ